MTNLAPMELAGALWFQKSGQKLFAEERIQLLEQIHALGSITKAARAVGISYKTAWDLVNLMNNLADQPLVARSAGGKGGGGTSLTPEGIRLVEQFQIFTAEHRRFLENIGRLMDDSGNFYAFLKRISLKVSARNVLAGTITEIARGAVNALVSLQLKSGASLSATITNASLDFLGLRIGLDAYAIIKASSVMLGTDLHDSRISASNLLCGAISKIIEGPVNTEVELDLGGGTTLSSVITHDSAQELGLKEGHHACALFSASSIILGVA